MPEFKIGDRVTFKPYTAMLAPPALWEQIGGRVATIVGPDSTRDFLVQVDDGQYGVDRLFLRHAEETR